MSVWARRLIEALLNVIVFERDNWMFAFSPGSILTKSKICITAGLGPDWLQSLKKKMTEIRPIGPVCSSWTGKPPLSKVTSFKLELLLMDNLGLVVWGLDLVRILEFNLVSCEKHCWYVHGLYVIQHWYYFMWKPNLWHDFWHSSVQKQMNYPTKKAQKMNKDLCRISFISFFFFFFGRCHLEICNEIIYFEREGGKKSYWKIWGDVSFNTDIKCTTQRQIITCKEPWWEEMPRYESQTAELLLFSSDKCWKVFFCLWKLNVKKWQHFWKSDSSEVVFFLFFFFLTRRESTWWKPDLS